MLPKHGDVQTMEQLSWIRQSVIILQEQWKHGSQLPWMFHHDGGKLSGLEHPGIDGAKKMYQVLC